MYCTAYSIIVQYVSGVSHCTLSKFGEDRAGVGTYRKSRNIKVMQAVKCHFDQIIDDIVRTIIYDRIKN